MIDPNRPDYDNTPVAPGRPCVAYAAQGTTDLPAVSVVTPISNTAPRIFEETATCVRQQSLQNYEWIIVDDGSTEERLLEYLRVLASADGRIRVIRQHNAGPAAARNRAVRAARADFVLQLDSDDLIEPTFAEKCVWRLLSHPQYGFCNSYTVAFGDLTYLWRSGFDLASQFTQVNLVTCHAVIRRALHLEAGGYDETIRSGHEDWDYWLNLAEKGHWGITIPEFLAWYRRQSGTRIAQTSGDSETQEAFRRLMHRKHARLLAEPFPAPALQPVSSFERVPDDMPVQNPLAKPPGCRRMLLMVPWLVVGGADKFNLDLARQLSERGWEVTICTTLESDNPWLPEFARITSDIFILPNFLRLPDYPRFLRYIIESRQIDVALISNSALGYQLLPYLRSRCPGITFMDFNHMEEESWRNGGHARAGVGYQELLDLNIVSTRHLKRWMVERGASAERIEVSHSNIEVRQWDPALYPVDRLRAELDAGAGRPLLLYAGRICEQKRPRVMAEVVRRLAKEERLGFVCVVAGDGPDLPWLKEFVAQHELQSCCRFLGAVSLERMKELQAAADILFLPSAMEGLSLAIFEAMAMETVPVGADVGGQRELVTPECGYLIRHGDHEIEQYVAALAELIQSPEKRKAMA